MVAGFAWAARTPPNTLLRSPCSPSRLLGVFRFLRSRSSKIYTYSTRQAARSPPCPNPSRCSAVASARLASHPQDHRYHPRPAQPRAVGARPRPAAFPAARPLTPRPRGQPAPPPTLRRRTRHWRLPKPRHPEFLASCPCSLPNRRSPCPPCPPCASTAPFSAPWPHASRLQTSPSSSARYPAPLSAPPTGCSCSQAPQSSPQSSFSGGARVPPRSCCCSGGIPWPL